MIRYILVLLSVVALVSCQKSESVKSVPYDSNLLFKLNNSLTEAIIQDGFSPPVASRIYAYCNLTAQAVVSTNSDSNSVMLNELNGFEQLHLSNSLDIDSALVLTEAFVLVGQELVYRDYILDSLKAELDFSYLSSTVRDNSLVFAQEIAEIVVSRAKNDGYAETRTMPRYLPLGAADNWEPTPPGYMEALEPYWGNIQPFLLDSSAQFYRSKTFEFSEDKTSEFYENIVLEVYNAVNGSSDEDKLIAHFWDCNPFLTKKQGHLVYHVRQLTPGGHWLGITETACQMQKLNLRESANLMAMVSVALADGFITAWYTKFQTNFIRPETYINRYLDAKWKPILESPHFPEYTSAHSTVSAAAAYVLTNRFGTDFQFIDSTEVPIGLPPKEFNSFFEASNEASESRILGGIHFRPAIEVGIEQGISVGELTVTRLR